MSQRLLIPGVVLASCAGGFVLGWTLKPKDVGAASSGSSGRPAHESIVRARSIASQSSPVGELAKTVNSAGLRHEGPFASFIRDGAISSEDMTAAAKQVMRENDPLKRTALFAQLLEELTLENAVAGYDAIRGYGAERFRGGGDQLRLFLNAWGRIDGEAAVTYLMKAQSQEEVGRGSRSNWEAVGAVSGWAAADGDAAYAYVKGVEDDRQKGLMMQSIVSGLLVNGVEGAVDFVRGLPAEDENRRRYMATIANEMLEQGGAAAASWVDGIADDSLKGGALTRVADQYAREDLQAAVRWVTRHGEQDYAKRAVSEVAQRWAESDPKSVIEWASRLPEATQGGAYEEALDQWTENDARAASEYLVSMPGSAAKDSAISVFSSELAGDDPESAAVWAQAISNDDLRIQTLTSVVRDWLDEDRAAAEAWLPTSGIPTDTVEKITIPDQRRRGSDIRRE